MVEKTKKFFCSHEEPCQYKDHFINSRCFAPYAIRQSCPNIIRRDNKSWNQGSKEESVLWQ